MVTVAVSGGFDPIHSGHIELFNKAKALGDKLIVIINTDVWLLQKKGYIFMPLDERINIIKNIKAVDDVIVCIDKDHTVRETLRELRPDIFANGGDRHQKNTPEILLCRELGIKHVDGLGLKINSSSKLVEKIK